VKKRIWIKVEGIKLGPFQLVQPSHLDKEKHISVSVRIGDAFNINGVRIENGIKSNSFLQNWSGCDVRFLDIPGLHHGKHKKYPLLHDIFAKETYLFFNGKGGESLRELMETEKRMPNTSILWSVCQTEDGKSLRIPVEFIKLRNFNCLARDCMVADIFIGSHLVFWQVQIFDGKKIGISNDRIIDREISGIINKMLTERKAIQETINFVRKNKTVDIASEFIDAIPGINLKKDPTPIRFY
jgi:hypothetical protein